MTFAAMILAATLNLGCGTNSAPKSSPKASGTDHAGHDHKEGDAHAHAEEGPHHGHLIELGKEEYHAELTHDEATKTVAIYLLDGKAKNAVAISAEAITLNLVIAGKPQQVKLAAVPQESDPQSQSSCFSVTDEAVLEALEAPKTTGRLNVTIAGKPYVGTVEHHEHGEHEHAGTK